MDETGKLSPGIMGVTICLILLMAAVIPITAAMTATIPGGMASGVNHPAQTDETYATVINAPATLHYGADGFSYNSGEAQELTAFFFMCPSAFGVLAASTDPNDDHPFFWIYKAETSSSFVYAEVDMSLTSSGLTITADGAELISSSDDWVMIDYVPAFGVAATHIFASGAINAVLGDGDGVLVKPTVTANSKTDITSIHGMIWYDKTAFMTSGETRPYEAANLRVNETNRIVDGIAVKEITSITDTSDDSVVDGWFVPLKWRVVQDGNNLMVKNLLNIVPVLLLAALILMITRWMGRGGTSRGFIRGRIPGDGVRSER